MPSWRPWTSKESSSYPLGQTGAPQIPPGTVGSQQSPPTSHQGLWGHSGAPPKHRHGGKAVPGASPTGMEGGTERNLNPASLQISPPFFFFPP